MKNHPGKPGDFLAIETSESVVKPLFLARKASLGSNEVFLIICCF